MSKHSRWFTPGVVLLVLVTTIAYSAAIRGPELFDDPSAISENQSITTLWPPAVPLRPPAQTPTAGRPVANVSLAINYAVNRALGVDQPTELGGPNGTIGYHVLNILLHLASGLLLLGILRRTLRSARLDERWTRNADGIALAVTAAWLLHPLQTEAVNYLTQRTELLVSCCYLGTLYCSIRAWDAASRAACIRWYAAGVAACLLGMGSKEVMVSAPLMVMLYDRAFRVESWAQVWSPALRARRWYYAALFATLIPLLALVSGGGHGTSIGFDHGLTWYQYLISQGWAITHYLRLVFLPTQLSLDYGFHPIPFGRSLPGLLLLIGLGVATVVAWTRVNRWGWFAFCGAWFFCLLAPSSSIVPITTEIAAERRIYLALAAVLVVLGVLLDAATRRWRPRLNQRVLCSAGIALCAVLALATFLRGRLYEHPESLWRDATIKQPGNARAWNNLGDVLSDQSPSNEAEADSLFRIAIRIDSGYATAWYNLASSELRLRHFAESERYLRRALTLNPTDTDAATALGNLLLIRGDATEALSLLERGTRGTSDPQLLVNLGIAYMTAGREDDAATAFRRALDLDHSRLDAMQFLGAMLTESGHAADAVPTLEDALLRNPGSGLTVALLSLAYAETQRGQDAITAGKRAVELGPTDARVFFYAGRAMVEAGRPDLAEQYLARTVELAPGTPGALTAFGELKRRLGKPGEARDLFRRALQQNPDDTVARDGLSRLGAGHG